MLRLSELKLPLDHSDADLEVAICRRLRLRPEQVRGHRLVKRSVDARRQGPIRLVYSLDVDLALSEAAQVRLLQRFANDPHLRPSPDERYQPVREPVPADWAGSRPLVVGAGPCGYFAALLLAQLGLQVEAPADGLPQGRLVVVEGQLQLMQSQRHRPSGLPACIIGG